MANETYARARWLNDAEVDALESIDLGAITRALAPVQKQLGAALPGAVQGATAGAAAGPWGALIGGLAGGALSVATKQRPRRPAAPPSPTPVAPAVTGEPTAMASPATAPVATSPGAAPTAVGQLVQLLQNPAMHRAVGALASGQGGEPGGVPVGAVLNLLGTLANNAAYEAEAIEGETDDSYLRGADGHFLRDPSTPAERAAVVWDRLFQGGAQSRFPGWEGEGATAEWFVDAGIAERL